MSPFILVIQILFFLLIPQLTDAQKDNPNFSRLTHEELDSFANLYFGQGQYEIAILCVKEIIKKSKSNKQDSTHGLWTNNLGVLYQRMGKYAEAETLFLESKEARKRAFGETSEDHLQTLRNLAYVYKMMLKNEALEAVYLDTRRILKIKPGTESEEYAQIQHNLGDLYIDLGRYEEVEPLFIEAKDIRRRVLGEQHENYATSLNNLALVYDKMGKYEEAEPLYIQANKIYIASVGEKSPRYATALDNLALLYQKMERYEASEALFLQAKLILQEALGEQHQDYSYCLNNLAILYQSLKRYQEAEPLLIQAVKIRKTAFGEKDPRYARALNNLAQLYKSMGQYTKAETIFKQAIEINRIALGEGHSNYADYLAAMGNFYSDTDRLDIALSYAWAAIAVNSSNFDAFFPTIFGGNSDTTKGKYSPLFCNIAVPTADFLNLSKLDYRSSISNYEVFKVLLKTLKKRCEALDSTKTDSIKIIQQQIYNTGKAAMLVNEKIRNEFSGDNNKLRILKQNTSFVQYALEAVADLDDESAIEEAFSFAEQNKSVLLADAVKGNRARALGDLPDSLALKELDLHHKKELLKKQKAEAKTPESKDQIIALENDLNAEIDIFLKSLQNKYPKYHALKYENITSNAKDIQALLDDKTLFLEYFITPTAVYLFALTKNNVQLFPLKVKKETLTAQIQTLRTVLSNYKLITKSEAKSYDLYARSAYWFYKELVKPALTDAKISTSGQIENLVLVTDGELGHLPFEAFLSKEAEQTKSDYAKLNYLVNDYNISYNYSATLFAASRKENVQNSISNKGQILACAASYTAINSTNLLEQRSPYFIKLRKELSPLPAAIQEVKTLSESFQGLFLTGDGATETEFKKHSAEYSIIHLAMHGILHPRTPMLSSLAFTEDKDSLEDNFLQAYEISRLKLNAELVVLSACETGYGQFEQGEGVISLARSFMYAGVPSLVVSLWQVNDASTAWIMKGFYQNLSKGLPKNIALRNAKLDYIKNAKGIMAHPAFWSPFIQLGDSRPIVLGETQSLMWWVLGAAFLLVGGVVVGKRFKRK